MTAIKIIILPKLSNSGIALLLNKLFESRRFEYHVNNNINILNEANAHKIIDMVLNKPKSIYNTESGILGNVSIVRVKPMNNTL